MSAQYALTPRARADLRGIWRYTATRWNLGQADRYIAKIQHALQRLASDPLRGRPCDEVRLGLRRDRVESHMIFFRTVVGGIEVMRVLHQRMDFAKHL